MAVGEGLLTTLKPSTGSSQWVAFQFLVGFGLGTGMQTVPLAVQATMPKEDVPTGVAITLWAQHFGGAVFVSVGQAILSGLLVKRLHHVPDMDASFIVSMGATELLQKTQPEYRDDVVNAYNFACTRIFLAALVLSCVQLVFACLVP